jgi:hypothetical protein
LFSALAAICNPNGNFSKCTGPEWKFNVDLNPADVLTDIGACKLRNVIWVIPTGQNSDHPGPNGNTGGPPGSPIVNKIRESPCTEIVNGKTLTYCQDTATFITWDDWGGWYDYEPPTLLSVPQQGQGDYQYGFRIARRKAQLPEDLVLYCARHDYLSRRSSSARRRIAIIHKSRLTAVGELGQLECKGIHVPIHVTPKNGSHPPHPDDVATRLAAGGGDVSRRAIEAIA